MEMSGILEGLMTPAAIMQAQNRAQECLASAFEEC
jgi:hypothetical protein